MTTPVVLSKRRVFAPVDPLQVLRKSLRPEGLQLKLCSGGFAQPSREAFPDLPQFNVVLDVFDVALGWRYSALGILFQPLDGLCE